MWLTVINGTFHLPPHLDPFNQVNYLHELSSYYPIYLNQEWYTWASFQTSQN